MVCNDKIQVYICLATKTCNASHRRLKVYIFIECLFDIDCSLKLLRQNKNHTSPHILFFQFIIVEEETHHLNGTGNNVRI